MGLMLVPLLAWVTSTRERNARLQLTRAGFQKAGTDLWLRKGVVPVHARRQRERGQSTFVLEGPELPDGAPGMQPVTDDAPPGRRVVRSGDDRFDGAVRMLFPRPGEALAWLTPDVRTHGLRAVMAGARLERGRWTAERDDPPGGDLADVARAIAKASQAMAAAPPDVDEALRSLLTDASPGVRVQAMEAMVDRTSLEPSELDTLAAGPFAEVHVAVIGLGGEAARVAFRELQRHGSRRQRAQGAVELERKSRRGEVRLDEEAEQLVDELIEALEDDHVGDRAARQLRTMGRADLPRRLGERFGADPPKRVQALRQALVDKHGDGARGALSVVAEGGGLAMAEPPRPKKTPEPG